MNKKELIDAIEKRRGNTSYGAWQIGITGDPNTRKEAHKNEGKNVTYWTQWKANSREVAEEVEAYFIDKGMAGGAGPPPGSPTYVYIF